MAAPRLNDPYRDEKVYHFAAKFTRDGNASALCYKRPRVISHKEGQSWTIRPDAVTCPKCRAALKAAGRLST